MRRCFDPTDSTSRPTQPAWMPRCTPAWPTCIGVKPLNGGKGGTAATCCTSSPKLFQRLRRTDTRRTKPGGISTHNAAQTPLGVAPPPKPMPSIAVQTKNTKQAVMEVQRPASANSLCRHPRQRHRHRKRAGDLALMLLGTVVLLAILHQVIHLKEAARTPATLDRRATIPPGLMVPPRIALQARALIGGCRGAHVPVLTASGVAARAVVVRTAVAPARATQAPRSAPAAVAVLAVRGGRYPLGTHPRVASGPSQRRVGRQSETGSLNSTNWALSVLAEKQAPSILPNEGALWKPDQIGSG